MSNQPAVPISTVSAAREAIAACRHLATMSEEPGRTTRRFLTPPVAAVHAWLRHRMIALGMSVSVDAAGNLRGLWSPTPTTARRLIIGSHIDTVPDAGAFDGVLGVVLALQLVAEAQTLPLPYAIEVIAFSEEEGVRFGVPYLGSRAVAGRFDPALLALTDHAGITLDSAIRAFGLDPDLIPDALAGENAMAYLEIHIEQGPVLEAENLQLAAVTAVVGQTRCELRFTGHANHAGTTPMALRHDSLAAAADWAVFAEAHARAIPDLVATVGRLHVEPGAANVIPGVISVSLDVRHARDQIRRAAVQRILEHGRIAAASRGVAFEILRNVDQPAVPMDEELTALLAASLEAAGHPARLMPSGAGHDAMILASRLPCAMLFLRTPGGISHHPDENVLEEDVAAALTVSRLFLQRLSTRATQNQ
jgi:allantoate deiminase